MIPPNNNYNNNKNVRERDGYFGVSGTEEA